MLTISEIKNKKFNKSAFGYRVEEVESFLNDIIDLVSSLEDEKAENEKKLVVLASKIEEYRNEEDSLRQALLGAQKLGDSILKEAKSRAEILMRDATIKSENIIKNIKNDVQREEVILNRMKREVDAFRTKILTMYGSHIDMLKSLPELEHKEEQQSEQKAEEITDDKINEETVSETVAEQKSSVQVKEPEVQAAAAEEEVNEPTVEIKKEKSENDFKIDGGFKFTHVDDTYKHESKFGPLKFGDGYDLDDEDKK